MPSQLPVVTINYNGLLKYAEEKGVQPSELTDDEKNQFITDHDMDWVRKQPLYATANFSSHQKQAQKIVSQ